LPQRHEDVELLPALERLEGTNRCGRERPEELHHDLLALNVIEDLDEIPCVERDREILAGLLNLQLFISVAGDIRAGRNDKRMIGDRELNHTGAVASDQLGSP